MFKRRKWEKHEIDFILNNYRNMTAKDIANALGRSEGSTLNKIYKITTERKQKWEKHEVDFLLDNYNNMTYLDISKHLNKSETSITKKLHSLGIYKSKEIYWSEEDDRFLEDNWGLKSCKSLAKHLNRSVNAVQRRGYDKGFGGMYVNNFNYTITELRDIFNVDRSVIENWINKKGLKSCTRAYAKKKTVFIRQKDLHTFLYENQHLWNAAKANTLLLDIADDWLYNKLKSDEQDLIKMKSNTFWTTKEEDMLIDMTNNGYTIKEISYSLNRSKYSVQCKRKLLKKDNRI